MKVRSWQEGLSRACLASGLPIFVDDRLFSLHPDRLLVPPSAIEDDRLGAYDALLRRLKGDAAPSLLIACRTQLDRTPMLTRAFRSFAREERLARSLVRVSLRLVTDVASDVIEQEAERLRDLFPQLDLSAWHFPVRDKRRSRIDLLFTAARAAEAEFIWFVDDDDFLLPGALQSVARVLRTGMPQLVVGHSRIFRETWSLDPLEHAPIDSQPGSLYPAERVLWALAGDNHTPLCSAIFPVVPLRERIQGAIADGEYMEDYFLLLQLLIRGEILVDTLDVELAGISIRGAGNTVTMTDRTDWHRSQAEFVGETLARSHPNNPLLWSLTAELVGAAIGMEQALAKNAVMEQQAAQLRAQFDAVLASRSWRFSRPLRAVSALIRRMGHR